MKLIKKLGMASAFAIAALTATNANAWVFVGSWSVYNDDAPIWSAYPPNGPLAYTGQEAAALLFGPGNYLISTVDANPANINFSAWYDTIGYGGQIKAQNYNSKYLGLYYGPTSGYSDGDNSDNAASAFVRDNGVTGVNYAFVPEPASWAMMIIGFGLVGAGMRRRQYATA